MDGAGEEGRRKDTPRGHMSDMGMGGIAVHGEAPGTECEDDLASEVRSDAARPVEDHDPGEIEVSLGVGQSPRDEDARQVESEGAEPEEPSHRPSVCRVYAGSRTI